MGLFSQTEANRQARPIALEYVGATHEVDQTFPGDPERVTISGLPEADVTPAAAQADSTATTVAGLVTDFNALLAKLRAAGFLAS